MNTPEEMINTHIEVPFMINPLWNLSDEELKCLATAAKILAREKFGADSSGMFKQPKVTDLRLMMPWVLAMVVLIFFFAITYVGLCGCH